MAIAAVLLLAYLIGSVSFAVVVSRAMKLPDPRTYGSNNPGATNVLRTGRKAAAALTLIGDCAKGWFAVFLTERYFGGALPPVTEMALAAVAVFRAARAWRLRWVFCSALISGSGWVRRPLGRPSHFFCASLLSPQ